MHHAEEEPRAAVVRIAGDRRLERTDRVTVALGVAPQRIPESLLTRRRGGRGLAGHDEGLVVSPEVVEPHEKPRVRDREPGLDVADRPGEGDDSRTARPDDEPGVMVDDVANGACEAARILIPEPRRGGVPVGAGQGDLAAGLPVGGQLERGTGGADGRDQVLERAILRQPDEDARVTDTGVVPEVADLALGEQRERLGASSAENEQAAEEQRARPHVSDLQRESAHRTVGANALSTRGAVREPATG